MQKEDAEIGGLVVLNSGGPPMTIIGIEPPNEDSDCDQAWCSWIGSNGEGHAHCFPLPCITKFTGTQ
ncbi:DUF2158 domain-containing protein [Hyphomicrobium sp.]|uniref:DUF2158 domain-containing protein n=1 Tax=Hyphomicrobium sp. TaxID=82 RepID=UPI001DA8E121|nr:DUF2158 domain-containing protein [Hyphomicrobium sp.]MBY0561411.1 YodC family protein [Hyphomicrobium sp.]